MVGFLSTNSGYIADLNNQTLSPSIDEGQGKQQSEVSK
jgi:hypothetical protein